MNIRAILIATAIASGLLLGACGPSEYTLTGTNRAVGADGVVTVDEIEGGNFLIELEAQHLPPPDRIQEGATVYLVWIKPDNAQPVKAGTLEYDADDRTGSMRATSPAAERFEVIVTAERQSAVAAPSDTVVLKKQIRM